MSIVRTTRVYKRATGARLKRAGWFATSDIPRSEMDLCLGCVGGNSADGNCDIKEGLHEQECVIACDYHRPEY